MKTTEKYNIVESAKLLGIHEQTLRYWIKKGWVTPKRDHRNYPVFTPKGIEEIKVWRNTLK